MRDGKVRGEKRREVGRKTWLEKRLSKTFNGRNHTAKYAVELGWKGWKGRRNEANNTVLQCSTVLHWRTGFVKRKTKGLLNFQTKS